jgi:saposin
LVAAERVPVPIVVPAGFSLNKCDTCHTVVSFIEKMVTSKFGQEAIEKGLDLLCLQLPFGSSVCERVVDVGLPIVINLIEQKETPEVVCKQLKLCDTTAASAVAVAIAVPAPAKQIPTAITCPICKIVVKFVEDKITAKTPIEKIKTDLEEFCGTIPKYLRKPCDDAVEYGIDNLVALVEKETPEVVCQQLKLCSATRAIIVSSSFSCDMCTFVVGSAIGWVTQNSTIVSIEQFLDQSCSKMGSFSQSVCEKFVDFVIRKLMAQLNGDITANKICTQIGICTSSARGVLPLPEYAEFAAEIKKLSP